jgi:hypothetical protein
MAEVLALALEHIPVETIALDATNLRGIEGSDSALYEYYLRIGFIHDRFGNYNSFYQSSQEIIARNSLHRYPLEWLWAIEH